MIDSEQLRKGRPWAYSAAKPGGGAWWRANRRPAVGFVACVVLWLVVFCRAWVDLFQLAFGDDLYSHVLLIPFITGYLIWTKRQELQAQPISRSPLWGLVGLVVAMLPLLGAAAGLQGNQPLPSEDRLCLLMVSFVLLVISSAVFCFGTRLTKEVAMPLALLFFLAPFPSQVESGLEIFFQHASADAASLLFHVAGTPVFRQGLIFRLPNIVLEVARECSGIRSSLVLFITSLIAGYLFLPSFWRRTILTVAVIPLAILRNGFRIFTIGLLCVHISPDMINSWIHRKGGPLFFVLSLIPFFGLLVVLRRSAFGRDGSSRHSPPH